MSKDDVWHLYAASVYGAILARHSFWTGENGVVTTDSVNEHEMELAMQTAAALLGYLRHTQKGTVEHIKKITNQS